MTEEAAAVPQQRLVSEDEQALLQRLRAGEDKAFSELFELHAAAVRRLARGLAADLSEAEDITAETFFRVLPTVESASAAGRRPGTDASLTPWISPPPPADGTSAWPNTRDPGPSRAESRSDTGTNPPSPRTSAGAHDHGGDCDWPCTDPDHPGYWWWAPGDRPTHGDPDPRPGAR